MDYCYVLLESYEADLLLEGVVYHEELWWSPKYLTGLPPLDCGFEYVLPQGQNLVKIEITARTIEEQP